MQIPVTLSGILSRDACWTEINGIEKSHDTNTQMLSSLLSLDFVFLTRAALLSKLALDSHLVLSNCCWHKCRNRLWKVIPFPAKNNWAERATSFAFSIQWLQQKEKPIVHSWDTPVRLCSWPAQSKSREFPPQAQRLSHVYTIVRRAQPSANSRLA